MAGRWNKKLERSYQRLKNGTFDFDDFNSIFNTIKPFCYSQRPVASQVVYTNESTNETVEYGNLKVPIQIKDSEVVLLAMYSTLVSPLNKSERLVGLNKFMDDNDIDIVVFESGVKAGGQLETAEHSMCPDLSELVQGQDTTYQNLYAAFSAMCDEIEEDL